MSLNTFLLPPITIPQDRLFRQTLLVFDKVFLYAASEDACDDNLYTQNHLLKHYAPLPFGNDLDNFKRLIKDIKGNRAEYYSGGLYSMSVAANQVDEGAVWQLVSDIMSPESRDDKYAKTMLEARLILRLAEIVTAEEEEICRELDKVDQLADSLLDELKDVKTAKLTKSHLSSAVSMNLPKLVRAWGYLFLADSMENRPWIATTASLEVFEMLADHYSTNINEQPLKICSLLFPDQIMDDEGDFIDRRNEIRNSLCPVDLENILREAAEKGTIDSNALSEIEAVWQGKADSDKEGYSGKIEFYLFQGVSLSEIFSRVSKSGIIGENNTLPPHGIVAVVSSAL
jgi:hypothetical protein